MTKNIRNASKVVILALLTCACLMSQVFTGSTAVTITPTTLANPSFNLAAVSGTSPILFAYSPTVNVTAPLITNPSAGARFIIRITSDGTHTWNWNGIIADGVCPIYTDGAGTTEAHFVIDPNGTTIHGESCFTSIAGMLAYGTTVSAPTITPAAGNMTCMLTSNGPDCLDSNGIHHTTVAFPNTPFFGNLPTGLQPQSGQAALSPITVAIPASSTPGADQTIVSGQPAGTVFVMGCGIHREQVIVPLSNQRYIAASPGCVDMRGSSVLTGGVAAGSNYTFTGVTNDDTPDPRGSSLCAGSTPLCINPASLVVNGKPLTRIASVATCSAATITTGQYYYNTSSHYICMKDNPAGQMVELSDHTYPYAIGANSGGAGGNPTGVVISGIVVEQYANYFQFGMIGSQYAGGAWVLDHVEIKLAHATGVVIPSGFIRYAYMHDNGCDPFEIGNGANYSQGSGVEFSEISANNWAGFDEADEAGPGKFISTYNAVFLHNYSHDNFGSGFWADISNVGLEVAYNIISYNHRMGIHYEISYNGKIHHNVLINNGPAGGGTLGIFISTSANTEVWANQIWVTQAGAIGVNCDARGNGPDGKPYLGAGTSVHGNDIYISGSQNYADSIISSGQSLATGQCNSPNLVLFFNNHYHMDNIGDNVLYTSDNGSFTFYTLTSAQSAGYENGSTIDTNQ